LRAPVYKAAPADVPPMVSGYLGLYWGSDRWSDGLTTDNFLTPRTRGTAFVYGGEGRLNYWLASGMSLQVDVEAEATTRFKGARGFTNDDDGRLSGVFGGHWSWRNQQYLFGAFGALAYANNMGEEGSMNHGIAGVEGQLYLGNITLYGQAGGAWAFGSPATGEDIPRDLWFLRGVGRWFATPNDKLQGEVGYARMGNEVVSSGNTTSHDGNIFNWGASYEHRFAVPISIFAEYAGSRFTGGHGCKNRPTDNVIKVGAKFYFNQNTLFANDRNGATLDMPKFPKSLPWADTANDCFGVL
jgi:hypothetical protein